MRGSGAADGREARPPRLFMGASGRYRRRKTLIREAVVIAMTEGVNWDGIRAEYLAGGVSQEALAAKHGVTFYALRKVARAEGWASMRNSAAAPSREATGGGEGRREEADMAEMWTLDVPGGGEDRREEGTAPGGDAAVAQRLRSLLLRKLERAAAILPDDATEQKTQDGSAVKLLKLRDLTAAYKELVGDLAAEDGDGGENRVLVDL